MLITLTQQIVEAMLPCTAHRLARLDSLVTVVDAPSLMDKLQDQAGVDQQVWMVCPPLDAYNDHI